MLDKVDPNGIERRPQNDYGRKIFGFLTKAYPVVTLGTEFGVMLKAYPVIPKFLHSEQTRWIWENVNMLLVGDPNYLNRLRHTITTEPFIQAVLYVIVSIDFGRRLWNFISYDDSSEVVVEGLPPDSLGPSLSD